MEDKLIKAYKALSDVTSTPPTPETSALIEEVKGLSKSLRLLIQNTRNKRVLQEAAEKLELDLK